MDRTQILNALIAELRTVNAPLALSSNWQDWFQTRIAAIDARVDPRTERAVAKQPGAVAVVPINGVIMPKSNIWEQFGLATSAQTIERRVRAALAEPEVKAVVLDVDSPGGVTSGVTELAAQLRAMRGSKPIVAHADYLAASAAYWIAASVDEIDASPSAQVGMVGVYLMHVDRSEMLKQAGVGVTLIAEPAEKIDGNPFEPLSDRARDYLQSMVSQTADHFRADVAAGRGISKSAVTDAWAHVYSARDALAIGMIDKIRTFDETLAAFGVSRSSPAPRAEGMRSDVEARQRSMDLLRLSAA